MIPRFKKVINIINPHMNQAQFLAEHNKLSPTRLKATIPLLSRFRIEKASLFKDDGWPMDTIRKPFISWLMSLALEGESAKLDKK